MHAGPDRDVVFSIPESLSTGLTIADSSAVTVNPHSDMIFRATGATSCWDCRRTDKAGRMNVQV